MDGNQILQGLIARGLPPHVAAGFVGNFMAESSLNPYAPGDGGTSFGLAQWHKDRKDRLNAFAQNSKKGTIDTQLDFVMHELGTTHKNVLKALEKAKTVEEATAVIARKYEVPADVESKIPQRIKFAQNISGLRGYTGESSPQYMLPERFIPDMSMQGRAGSLYSAPEYDGEDEDKKEVSQKQQQEVAENNFLKELSQFQSQQPQEQAPQQYQPSYLEDSSLFQIPEFQVGGKKRPFKPQDERLLNTKQSDNISTKKDLSLIIAEYNNIKKDKEELQATGQIKLPRSIQYRKNIKPQAEVRQDNISAEQRTAQLSPLERPLIYLANPDKALGDIGVPTMETSELDRQAVAANRFNSNQTRFDRFKNSVNLGLGYVPEAVVNTALAAAFMPEGRGALGLVNEVLNPLAGTASLIDDFGREGKNLIDAFNPKLMVAESGEKWINDWYSHPQTKINASAYENINEAGDFKEIDGATKIEIAKQDLKQYEDKNYLDLLKDKGLKTYLDNILSSAGLSYGVPESIYVKSQPFFGFNKVRREGVKVHELTHLAENNGDVLNTKEINELLEPFGYDQKSIYGADKTPLEVLGSRKVYYLDPTEIHARMNQARYQLGITPDDIFTAEQFDKIQKEKDWFGMGRYIKDKDKFIKLMNNFYTPLPIAGASYLTTQGQEELPQQQNGGVFLTQDGFLKREQQFQDGGRVDMHNNPITSSIVQKNIPRSYYDGRTDEIVLGDDYLELSKEEQEKLITHENRHAWQYANNRSNFKITHQPEKAFNEMLLKKPSIVSTDENWHGYHNRKGIETAIDIENFRYKNPTFNFVNSDVIFDRAVDEKQYENPYTMEGEATFYENTGKKSFQQGGVIKDDNGYLNPDNWGKTVEINSPHITMKGVEFPLLGISKETGEVKKMMPGNEYYFKNTNSVIEQPILKKKI